MFRALTHLPLADILRGCPLAPRWLISDSSTWSFTEAERDSITRMSYVEPFPSANQWRFYGTHTWHLLEE